MLLNIFNDTEIDHFDGIPDFDDDQKETVFNISSSDEYRSHFRKPSTLVVFILLKGYFQITGRFYQVKDFNAEDIQYVCERLNLKEKVTLENYRRNTFFEQKRIITKSLGVTLFTDWKALFEREVDGLVKTALKPKQIVQALIRICQEKKIEIPRYHVFAQTITTSIRKLENDLIKKVENNLDDDQKEIIDTILELGKDSDKPISPTNPYLITTIKTPEQEITARKIRSTLNDFEVVSDLYRDFKDTLDKIELSDQLLNYYAVWLIKSRHVKFLAIKEPSKKYLFLLAFIVYQYRIRQDLFVDTLIKSAQKFQNEVDKSITDDFLKQKPVRVQQTRKIINMVRSLSDHVQQMREVIFSSYQSDKEKVKQIQGVFSKLDSTKGSRQDQTKKIEEELEKLESSLSSGLKDQMMFENYLNGYRRIQNRVAGIVKILDLNYSNSNNDIIAAVEFFKSHDQVNDLKKLPQSFLDQKSKNALRASSGSEWKLWKVLLFIQIKEHIKAGSLNLNNSERYRAVEEYLISEQRWKTNKADLLKRANLPFETDVNVFLLRMSQTLHNQYVKTNVNVDQNEFISFTSSGSPKITTPKVEKKEESGLLDLLQDDKGGIVPLPVVLSQVNMTSHYLQCFSHFGQKDQRRTPTNEAFYAAIIALGCNIGVRKMAQISNGVTADSLNHLVKWYFSKENLDTANAKINSIVNEMSLPKVYKKSINENHTSSDGQKFSVVVPSIHANYSYKYFGSGQGVSAYSFIDETNRLYYNTVISSSEREAAYVIDGLMHNEDVESYIHSTDTHGYSEIIFAITNGIGVFFAPRIKNHKNQVKYTFRDYPKREYEKKNYRIIPSATSYIDTEIATEQWDNVLRLLVTIKLREITSSRILKRLSSYSKQHPLHRALKQVGRIFKTYFLLKYLDEVELRQSTEKALNRIEQSHQFAKAIFFGNNQDIKVSTKEEQEVVVATRHLIQNTIILWNYLTISDKLSKASNEALFKELLSKVKNGSIMTWQHINIHGEYNFQKLFSKGEKGVFEFERIKALQIDDLP